MTELQPTEIELTGRKKKKASLSKRKIAALISVILAICGLTVLIVLMANRASVAPDLVQPGSLPAEQSQN